jgi:transcription elongation GreA/GreB family factor
MSRAFVKELESDTTVPDRPISTHPNYVTEAGRTAIENALDHFEAAHKTALGEGDEHAAAAHLREVRYWRSRLASAQVVRPPADRTFVHFGAKISIRRDDGREQTFRIVGEDEADPSRGTVSHASPIARAMIGHKVGDTVDISGQEAIILKID